MSGDRRPAALRGRSTYQYWALADDPPALQKSGKGTFDGQMPLADRTGSPASPYNARMSAHRKRPTDDLAALYSQRLTRRSAEQLTSRALVNPDWVRKIDRLGKQGVSTVGDLLDRLPRLSPDLKQVGIELIALLRIRQAIPVLLDMISEPGVRLLCATTLSFLKPRGKATQFFVGIGHRELASHKADPHWLDAVVHGLGFSNDQNGVELLVTIFERTDLPGPLRGEAADKLGCCGFVCDRRTRLFRRCRDAAIRGLADASIYVQFGSMSLIGALCSRRTALRPSASGDFDAALPRLRKFAGHDNRLAPGYWWPMSAEAEDVISCIKDGHWPDPEAADRWSGNTERGEWDHDWR